jgi:hypothetical protein
MMGEKKLKTIHLESELECAGVRFRTLFQNITRQFFFLLFFFFFFFFLAARNQYSMASLVLPPLLAEELGGGDSTIAAVHEYICGRAAKKWALADAEGVAALWNALCLRAFPLALVGVNVPYV